MEIIINTKQLERLKSTYRTKYVDNSELYKGPRMCGGVNQNLNKLKIIDIIEQYGDLVSEYRSIFRREKPIGECEDGSPIQLYTIDKTKTQKPIILIVGGVHGDEKTSIHGIYETVKFLLMGSKWSRFITSNFVVQIIPCLNVYGFNNNKRNNSNDKDLNRDFIKTTQKETKALTNYIHKNKDRIKIILDSHNAYNEEFVSCKQEMKYFEEYEDVAFKLNLFLNGQYETTDKKSFLWISRSQNDGTLSDFINKNKFIGHTVESPRSLVKEIHYPNPVNYEDGAEVTKDLLVNLMYIYGKMYNDKLMNESKYNRGNIINENYIDELQVYHGSQSDFDKFNHKKFLSTGAGSQVFGWGTYVTDDVAIAQSYTKVNNDKPNNEVAIDGKRMNNQSSLEMEIIDVIQNDLPTINSDLYNFIMSEGSSNNRWNDSNTVEVVERIANDMVNRPSFFREDSLKRKMNDCTEFFRNNNWKEYNDIHFLTNIIEAYIKCIFFNRKQVEFIPSVKIVYEVNVPDDNGNNYIEWYEHFPKEYMERVLYTMASLKPKFIEMMCKESYPFASHLGEYLKLKGHPNFSKIIQAIANEGDYHTFFASGLYSNKKEGLGGEVYLMLQNYMGSAKAASLFLMQCGFDGIKYPTGTRMSKPNGANEDGLNYVIFDASKVKITNKTRI